jgi:UDP-glucuronate 4-epimerase
MAKTPILVTGAAGFIGMHTTLRLLAKGESVVGIDNLNDYYDVTLKEARLARLQHPKFEFHRADISDGPAMEALFAAKRFCTVIHLAAQAGVRYSLKNPHAYVSTNVQGFLNILEGCRHNGVEHLAYASSSSVYGGNTRMPFSEHDSVDHPVSLYGAISTGCRLRACASSRYTGHGDGRTWRSSSSHARSSRENPSMFSTMGR